MTSEAGPLLLALGRGCSEGARLPLLRIAQHSLGIGDRLLEKIAPVLEVGELSGKVGFPCGQSIAIGSTLSDDRGVADRARR